MFERTITSVITSAALAGAAMLVVFASGFALFALLEPLLGGAGGAAVVALAGALMIALFALYFQLRARRREREAAIAQAAMLDALPLGLGQLTREHPILATALTAFSGVLAARNPALATAFMQLLNSFVRR